MKPSLFSALNLIRLINYCSYSILIEVEEMVKQIKPSTDDAELALQKISHTFASLVSKIQQCLEKKGVEVEEFVQNLRHVRGVESPLMYSQRSLYDSAMEQIKAQDSVGDILPLISGYFSWFNHTPIEKMLEAHCKGDEQVRTTYRTFKALFEEFCVRMVTSCPKNTFGFERQKDAVKVRVKYDLMQNVAKVNELVAIKNIVALHIKVKKHALYLSSAEGNIVTTAVFLLPLFVAEAAFPLTAGQEASLGQCGVLQLECGHYRFTSPAWSKEREVSGEPISHFILLIN